MPAPLLLLGLIFTPSVLADSARCQTNPAPNDLQLEIQRSACRDFEKYRAVTIPQNDITPVNCAEYGVPLNRRVTTFSDALSLDCDVLEYRPVPPGTDLSHDPIGDLALACRTIHARQNLSPLFLNGIPGLSGTTAQKIEQRRRRSERAQACALEAFGSIYTLPTANRVLELESSVPTWGDLDEDLAVIDASEFPNEFRERLREEIRTGERTLESRRNPVDPRAFLAMINGVIADEHARHGTVPTRESEANWSPEFLDCFGNRMLWTRVFGKQLTALAIGRGDQFTPEGHEQALEAWILQQPDFSIEPAFLFRKAYQLNQGDVYGALRTVENVLSRHWTTPDRQSLVHVRKLRPLSQTLGAEEDVFGTWYHFFGVLLFGATSDVPGAAKFVAEVESLGSLVLGRFAPEPQETHINRSGARVGSLLRRSLEREEWRSDSARNPESLIFESYIRVDGNYRRPLRRVERIYRREAR